MDLKGFMCDTYCIHDVCSLRISVILFMFAYVNMHFLHIYMYYVLTCIHTYAWMHVYISTLVKQVGVRIS